MLDTGLTPFAWGKERRQLGEPFLAAVLKVVGGEGIGESLEGFRIATLREGIGGLAKADSVLAHALSEPVMLVEIEACREGKIGTDANEHATPIGIVDVEVVLDDPAFFDFQMPAVFFLVADGSDDPRGLAGLENTDDLVGFGVFEIGIQKLVPAYSGIIDDGRIPMLRAVLDPIVELGGNVAKNVTSHRIELPVGIEESDDTLFLLKGLNDRVQHNAIEASVMETDVILVMLVESVHGGISFQSRNRKDKSGHSYEHFSLCRITINSTSGTGR